jgi:uncharacterized membrane protein (GlpM family)
MIVQNQVTYLVELLYVCIHCDIHCDVKEDIECWLLTALLIC